MTFVQAKPVSDHSSRAKKTSNDDTTVGTSNAGAKPWDIERRKDGSLLVRMHSADRHGRPLPDAVFTFRKGDPQYEHWERLANEACAGAK